MYRTPHSQGGSGQGLGSAGAENLLLASHAVQRKPREGDYGTPDTGARPPQSRTVVRPQGSPLEGCSFSGRCSRQRPGAPGRHKEPARPAHTFLMFQGGDLVRTGSGTGTHNPRVSYLYERSVSRRA